MFESATQDSTRNPLRYATSLLMSLFAHIVLLLTLLLCPLLFLDVLQADEVLTFLIAPPAPPPPAPPPTPPSRQASAGEPTRVIPIDQVFVPGQDPVGIPPADEEVGFEPSQLVMAVPGVAGGPAGPGLSDAIATIIESNRVVRTPEAIRPEKKRAPIRVATLDPSRLIRRVEPVYPPLAIKARISGEVVIEAVIDEEGSVGQTKVLSGPVLLVDAALAAVRQWKYSPTVHNGEPISIIAIVKVVFQLKR